MAPPKYKTDGEYLAEFVPRCPDCRYELSGLADGNCPECGLAFRMYALERQWISRQRVRDDRYYQKIAARFGSLAILFLLLGTGPWAGEFLIFIPLFGSWVLAIALMRWVWADSLRTQAHLWLFTVIPLWGISAGVSASEYPMIGLGLCVAGALAISWTALKGSPLWSSLFIVPFGPAPLLLIGLAMVWEGLHLRAQGHYWSSFDWPAYPRWAALPVSRSILVGSLAIIASAAMTGVVLMFVKRALVRLRKRNWR